MDNIVLYRKGVLSNFSGYDRTNTIFVEVGIHRGRKEFFIDVEDVTQGKRLFHETSLSLNYLTYRATAAMMLKTMEKIEIVIPEPIKKEIEAALALEAKCH